MPLPTRLRALTSRAVPLAQLGPREQLQAGRLPRRLVQLVLGLWLYGTAMGLIVRGRLGADPWDVLHVGIQQHTGLSLGTVVNIVGVLVLLLWWPLRQMPGVGTVANAVIIGLATDRTLAWVRPVDSAAEQWAMLIGGIVLNGFAGALYIGAQLGPGPRDGLMTGLAARTGRSLRLVRTSIELAVLAAGWLLGGPVGVGTVLYALAIGPCVQLFLPLVTLRLRSSR